MDRFQPATRTWFSDSFDAPTGSSKTLAAFLAGIDALGRRDETHTTPGVRVLYISPLKALVYDIERNLRAPLVGIGRTAERLEAPFRVPSVAVRMRDTPQRGHRRRSNSNTPRRSCIQLIDVRPHAGAGSPSSRAIAVGAGTTRLRCRALRPGIRDTERDDSSASGRVRSTVRERTGGIIGKRPPIMVDVFISYSHEDEARAQDLARRLEARGLSVWWDRQIPPGKTWDQVIGKALEEARSIVVLWTSTSVESDWVKEEASRGSRRGVLVPVVFDRVEPPLGFGRIEAAELSAWDGADDDPELISFLAAVHGVVGAAPTCEAARPAAPTGSKTASRDARKSGRWSGLLIAVVALVLVAGGLGIAWWLSLEVGHRVDLEIWNVEGEDKGSLVASHSFSGAARGPMPGALVAQAGTWITETLVAGDSLGEVAVAVSVPADLEADEVSLRPSPPIALETHLYIIRDGGKVRVRSNLNRESLAMLDGDFVIEIGAVGYSSVPVRARTGQPVDKTVRLRPIRVKLAIEAVSGPENEIARSLAAGLSEDSRIEVFDPKQLERLRAKIAESRAAIGVNRAAQMAIRDSLGVDYIVSGVYQRQ